MYVCMCSVMGIIGIIDAIDVLMCAVWRSGYILVWEPSGVHNECAPGAIYLVRCI